MISSAFDWSSYEGAFGNGREVPEGLRAARAHVEVDDLLQALGSIAAFGLDSGHLTAAAAPLVGLLVDEGLLAGEEARPAWPYFLHVLLSLAAGRDDFGLVPDRFFVPGQSEAERIASHLERRTRQAHVRGELAAHRSALLLRVASAPAREAVYLMASLHSAGLLSRDECDLLADTYLRMETDAQRASLLLPCAAALAEGPHDRLERVARAAASDGSPYVRAAAWASFSAFPTASGPPLHGADEIAEFIAASDRLDDDYVWYDGLSAGVVCHALYLSRLPPSEKLRLLFAALGRARQGESDVVVPPVCTAAAAAWFVLLLVFERHYQQRSPLDADDLTEGQRAALSVLHENRGHWLALGSHYPTQFGVPEFLMEAEHLLAPKAPLTRRLSATWPGELRRTSVFSWILRPLAFPLRSTERAQAFALVARQLLADLDEDQRIELLSAVEGLFGFPCRELALALHAALDG